MRVLHAMLSALLALTLMITSFSLEARPSNKWRLQFSGKANSDGVIVIAIKPEDGETITTENSVKNNTGENGVARAVVKSLRAQLPKDKYHVERDDGEDVLIKKHHGDKNFDLEIVSNSVKGVHINPDRE